MTASNSGGSASASSAATPVVAVPVSAPTNTSVPSISGTAAVANTLTAGNGSWSNSPSSYSYKWEDCNSSGGSCAAISGATSSSYTVAAGDENDTLKVAVTASNSAGSSSASSAATSVVAVPVSAPANTSLPTISGTAAVGNSLTASNGSWSGSPTSYSYKWEDCNSSGGSCSAISGATASSYTVAAGDENDTIEVAVTASNSAGSASASSAATTVIAVPSSSNPNVYVGENTAGSGNGSSCANEESLAWLNNSSNWGSSAAIAPGTTVGLCGTIDGIISIRGSGTAGKPITLYWEPGAIVEQPYCLTTGCIWAAGASYITFNGGQNGQVISTANGTELANQQNAVGIDALGCNDCTIENLNVSNMYVMDGSISLTGNTNSSTTVTGASSTTGVDPGCTTLVGTGIPGGANGDPVTAVNASAGTITLQNATTATATGVAVTAQDGCGESNVGESAIEFGGGSNVTITGNTMHDDGWALSDQQGCSDANVTISDNDVYNNDHGLALATNNPGDCSGGNSSIGPVLIDGNNFHDYSNWDTPGDFYHHDGIHCYSIGAGGTTGAHYSGLYIYDNTFGGATDLSGEPDGDDMTSQVFLESGAESTPCADTTSPIYVFNNVASVSGLVNNGILGLFSGSIHEYNNTMIGSGPSGGACADDNYGDNYGATSFENNVMTGCQALVYFGSTTFAAGSPNDNVYANGGSQSFACNTSIYQFGQFSSWQSCIGGARDASSQVVASAGLGSSGAPTAGSAALDTGANLTSLCTGYLTALCTEINGTARPTTGSWNAGAY